MPFLIPPDATSRILEGVRRSYPDFASLPHEGFSRDEDAYKREASHRAQTLLAPEALSSALGEGRAEQVHGALLDVLTMSHEGQSFNLSGWRDVDALRKVDPEPFLRALSLYLHGGPVSPERFAVLFEAALAVKAHGGSTWTIATIFPHLYRPREDAFVKPEFLRQALVLLGHADAKRSSATTSAAAERTYADVLELYRRLLTELRILGAQDFIDVQGLLYVASVPEPDEPRDELFHVGLLPEEVRAFAQRYAAHVKDVFGIEGADDPRISVTGRGARDPLRLNVGMWSLATFCSNRAVQIVLHEEDLARLFPGHKSNLFANALLDFFWTTLVEAERPEVLEAWQKAVQMASEYGQTQRRSSWPKQHRPDLAAWLFDLPSAAPAEPKSGYGQPVFSDAAFDLLERLHRDPTKAFYDANKDALQRTVREPMKLLLSAVAERLPETMRGTLNTTKHLVSQVLKQFVQHGAYDYVWGAFTPDGLPRTQGPQLFVTLHHSGLSAGFSIGTYADDTKQHLAQALGNHTFSRSLEAAIEGQDVRYAREDEDSFDAPPGRSFEEWRMGIVDGSYRHLVRIWPREQAARLTLDPLAEAIADLFVRLYPLVKAAYSGYDAGPAESAESNPVVPLSEVAAATHLPETRLKEWADALHRKRQAIFYGPPGTGKTFVAQHLARHLVGGGNGFVETLQFHSAYAYEDFVQGLRPVADKSGAVRFELVPGRLLDAVRRARACTGTCVLLLDEINRADLARVFGELMYLLEYRDASVPLAGGGTLSLPRNLLLIGTMNTADRSIALVDHALRRRFAFFALAPNYDVLVGHYARYLPHDTTLAKALRKELGELNRDIEDPHLAVGMSFFLPPPGTADAGAFLREAWTFEIEPYLEELFHGHPSRLLGWRWPAVAERLGLNG